MTNRERVLAYLAQTDRRLCDDCLSERAGISPRQTIYQVGTHLKTTGEIERSRAVCGGCGKFKISNWLSEEGEAAVAEPSAEPALAGVEKPWYWEGNVQARLVEWLKERGCTITSTADTAAKTAGVDIVAERDGAQLWVSVKGYPEKSSYVQARHWFAGAVFDLVLYRGRSPHVALACAFPAGFTTYEALAPQVAWLREKMPFRIYWVFEDGRVTWE